MGEKRSVEPPRQSCLEQAAYLVNLAVNMATSRKPFG